MSRAWQILGAGALAVPAGLWACVTVGMYAFQDALVFPAPTHDRALLDGWAGQVGAHPIGLTASDGTALYGWHIPGDGTRALLVFHGNGGDASIGGWFGQQLPGVDVVSISYRGYPGSAGAPGEAGILLDARAAWDFVTGTLGIPPSRVVVHGQSLGGGVAVGLIAGLPRERQPAGLVLDSTFSSVVSVAGGRFPLLPVGTLLRHPFRSDLRAPDVGCPALVLHGPDDRVIPVDEGRRLSALLPDARYHELPPGWGHHTWLLDEPAAHGLWRAFLDEVLPAR